MITPLLYVAGPYSANDTYSEQDHIRRAEEVSIQLIRNHFHVICPHKNTSGYEKYEDDNINFDTWIEMDINILKRCDGLYLFGDYEKPRGAMIELSFAVDNDMPVFIDRLHPPSVLSVGYFIRHTNYLQTNKQMIYNEK